jgi:hypothetical protein
LLNALVAKLRSDRDVVESVTESVAVFNELGRKFLVRPTR